MEYRKLPRGGEEISILGFGTSSVGSAGEKEAEKTVELALENGINYFDMASADAVPLDVYKRQSAHCVTEKIPMVYPQNRVFPSLLCISVQKKNHSSAPSLSLIHISLGNGKPQSRTSLGSASRPF